MKYYKDTSNNVYAYESNGSQDHLISSEYVEITDDEARVINEEKMQNKFNALSYADKRQMEYPSIGDQLDALFKAGVFPNEMSVRIQSVKDKYPKG
jgi:hypothetical protein